MHDHPLANAVVQQFCRGGLDGRQVDGSRGTSGQARCALDLEFIQNAIIRITQGGSNDGGEPVAVLADDIQAGLAAGLPRPVQNPRRGRSEFGIGQIQAVEQQQVTQMEDPGFDLIERKMRPVQQGVGAALMEKCSPSGGLHRHDIGV